MARVVNAARQIKPRVLLAPFIFIILFVPSLFFRLINKIKKRKLWLVAEEGQARDNGYHFYKYIRLKHPNDYCFYAIKKESAGYDEVSKLGNAIKWGSLRHWFFYMSANLNISSQKSGNPCPIFWYVLHVALGLYRNRVFLQHGITKDDSKWIYNSETKFKYFICGAKREYDYILKKFGYKEDSLLLTGFPRWDGLKDVSSKQSNKSILIMPTWRKWLGEERNGIFKIKDFENTDFYKHWDGLLRNKKFIDYIEKNEIVVYFYPHIQMMQFIEAFRPESNNIKIVSSKENIQKYFNECNLMITDYSSVAFDFAYLRKPVIYYQFDKKEYRKHQLQEGYFKYDTDGFGPAVEDVDAVIKSAISCMSNGSSFVKQCDRFFDKKDHNNCERVYKELRGKS